jgi:ATP-binding cassette subfamily B (MDR/TAP) protein 1
LRNRLAQDEARETGHKDVPPGSLPVEFDNVDFAYQRRPDEPVLRDINLKVDAAKFVGLVGHSGCGKTTMVSLIQRFYDPTRGRVMLGDENTQDFELRKFRSSMAIVRQEPELYTGSIRDNISLGVEEGEPTDDDVLDALRQANIYDFVLSLPEGLQTSIGSYGTQLSGGQKQRLCLARALIRKPRILLLDEATSALDTHSEKLVKEALEKAAQGRTTISIAHRLSTIKDADMIVVLSGGQIQECGTHEELVMRRGVYFGLCLGQALDGPL